jgi:glycosyltransferase involved in cell wall biosynthesis
MENIVVEVCNRLDPARFAVTVCCLDRLGPFAERLRPEVRRVELCKAPGFGWRYVAALRRVMREGTFDVVHTHHLGGLIYAALARLGLGGPRVVHSEHIILHGSEVKWRRLWQRKLLYRFAASCVFAVSKQQVDQLRTMGLTHRKMFTLPNGGNCARFRPVVAEEKAALRRRLGLSPDGFWLGKVARFATAKRHLDLIAAFEKAVVSQPRLRLLLVGDGGSEKQAVLDRVESSPARAHIFCAGFQQDPAPWYQAMDALVVASSYEGLPNAVLEGMASGLPVLANAACGVRELARDGEHGWIGDLSTVDQLAAGLARAAAESPDRLASMGAAAAEHVRSGFSLEAMLEKYDRLYTAAAGGNMMDLEIAADGTFCACQRKPDMR